MALNIRVQLCTVDPNKVLGRLPRALLSEDCLLEIDGRGDLASNKHSIRPLADDNLRTLGLVGSKCSYERFGAYSYHGSLPC